MSSAKQTLCRSSQAYPYTHFLSQQVYWFKVAPWMKTNRSSNKENTSGIDLFRDRSLLLSPLATIGGTFWGSQSSPGFKALRWVSDTLPLPGLTILCPCLPRRQPAAQLGRHFQTSLGLARPHCLHSLPMAAAPEPGGMQMQSVCIRLLSTSEKGQVFEVTLPTGDGQDDQEGVFWARKSFV